MKQEEPKITLIKNLYFVLHEQLHTTKQPRTSGVIISKLVFPSLQDRDLLGLLLLNLLEGDGQHAIL